MKNLTATSALVLFALCIFLRLATANHLELARLGRAPAREPRISKPVSRVRLGRAPATESRNPQSVNRVRLGTFLQKQPSLLQQHSRYASIHGSNGNNGVLPVVNFTNMDGILLNLIMRRLSS